MKILYMVSAMCLLGAACNQTDSSRGGKVAVQEAPADWEITTHVKSAIMSDSSLSAGAKLVSVSTTNGVVTLIGSVPTKQDRERIVKLAKETRGVTKVDNQIAVSP